MEGYPVKKWLYPLNRIRNSVTPASYEFSPGIAQNDAQQADPTGQRRGVSAAFKTPYRDKVHGHHVTRSERRERENALGTDLTAE
jgi:hypothetical protein